MRPKPFVTPSSGWGYALRLTLLLLTTAFGGAVLGAQSQVEQDKAWWLADTTPVTVEDMEAIIDDYNRRIQSAPERVEFYIRRGAALLRLHRFEEAIRDFTHAIRLDDLDEAYFGRGMARGRKGEFQAGIDDLSEYIARNPHSSLAYTKRGIRYLWMGDRRSAKKDLAKALEINPGNAEAHDDLGVILAQSEDYRAAVTHFAEAIKLEPSYQKAYHNLAMVLYLTDQNQTALKVVDEGLRLRPNERDSMLLKAEILSSLGRHGEAEDLKADAEFQAEGDWSERAPVN